MSSINAQPLSRPKKLIFSALPVLILLFLLYFGSVVLRTNTFYQYLKTNQRGWKGKPFAYEPQLGFAPVPGYSGAEIVTAAPDVPLKFDQNGFRAPLDEKAPPTLSRPLLLTLGCSFSHGSGVPAEKTYPYLAAKQLNGSSINAAAPAYGAAQMLVLARRLIPKYKPDYVLVQFSSWLVDRSMTPFAASYNGKAPAPYFVDGPGGSVVLHGPVFAAKIFDLPAPQYRYSDRGLTDYLSFLIRVGLPLYVHDDYHLLVYHVKLKAGWLPPPTKLREKIVKALYGEIDQLCAANGSKMVIVVLHEPMLSEPTLSEVLRISSFPNALIIDTAPALLGRLPQKTSQAYYVAYTRYMDWPPVILDFHPNQAAHQIIADEIVKAIAHSAGQAKETTFGAR
jgi:hypothetical protein